MTSTLTPDQINRIRQALEDRLVASPLDFMPRPAAFRAAYIDDLLAGLGDDDDRSMIFTQDDNQTAVLARYLAWDSAFFGRPVVRLQAIVPLQADGPATHQTAVAHFLSTLSAEHYVLCTALPEDSLLLRALAGLRFDLLATQLTYHRPLATFKYPHRFNLRLARREDVAPLAVVARTSVNAYDRFHADPVLAEQAVDQLMAEWVRASVEDGFADAVFVPDVDDPRAFCTTNYHRADWPRWGHNLAQAGALAAVDPAARGWYLKLLAEITHHLKESGASHAYIKTQITNRAVIRVWEHLGYQYGRAEHVFRYVAER
jgi:hypothetical protein